MKRNMELVRELLLRVEAEQGFDSLTSKYSQEEIVGHVEILLDAKLLDGEIYHDFSGGPGLPHIQRRNGESQWRCRRETMRLRKSSGWMPCLSTPSSMAKRPKPNASARN